MPSQTVGSRSVISSCSKLDRRTVSAAIVSAAAFALSAPIALAQVIHLVIVDVATVARGFRVSRLLGRNVQNDKNEKIGTMDDLIIVKDLTVYAVLQVGGFLGLGGHLVAVPYNSLVIEQGGDKIILPGASKEELEKLNEFKY